MTALIIAGMINLRLPWERWPFRWIVGMGHASCSIYLLHYVVRIEVPRIALGNRLAQRLRKGLTGEKIEAPGTA